MPATLITSAAGYGKTREVIRRIKSLKRRNPFDPVWVLLPTDLQINAFRTRLMAEANEDTLFGLEFFDFYSLNARLLEVLGKPQRRAQDATRFRILRSVIEEQREHLQHFTDIADTPGFVQLVANFTLELKQALIQPEQFVDMVRTEKDSDLSIIYFAYQDFLRQQNIVDREGEGWLALALLEADTITKLPIRMLVVDGYDQFSTVQTRLLNHLADRVPDTILTMTYEPHRAETAHRRFAQTLARLLKTDQDQRRWQRVEAQSVPEQQRDPALEHLSANIFQAKTQPADASHAVRLIEAPNRRREVQTVLREIKGLLLMGTPADQIAIVARDLTEYTPYFLENATTYGVPLFFSRGLPLRENPAVAAFLALIDLAHNQFRRREVMDALHSPYLLPPDFTLAQIDALERLTRRYAVVRWERSWLEAIAMAGSAPTNDDDEPLTEEQIAANQAQMATLSASLEAFFARVTPPRRGTARQLIAWLEGLIGVDAQAEEEPSPTDSSFSIINQIRAGTEPPLVGRDLAAIKCLKSVFVELMMAAELVNPGMVFKWDEFRRDLLIAIDQATIDPPRSTNRFGRVLLTTIYAVRGLSHDHLFVLGLSEGEFPAATPEDALYLDTERQQLNAQGIDLATRAEAADESSLFYELVSLARQRLMLTRPYIDDNGAEWPASPYWRAVRETVLTSTQRLPIAQRPSLDEAAYPAEVMTAVADMLNDPDGKHEGILAAHGWLMGKPSLRAAWNNARIGRGIEHRRLAADIPHDRYTGRLHDPRLIEQVARELDGNRRWSASQINEYGICPYRFFAKRLLRLEALKEPDEGMDALQYGSMIHEILEFTYRQIGEESLSITPANRDRAVDILNAVMDDLLGRAPGRYGFRATRLWAHEQLEIRRRLTELLNVDFSDKSPLTKLAKGTRYTRHHEVSFGGEREDGISTEVVIDGEAGPIRIYGVIDRVDQVGDQLLVVDYKTGSKKIPHDEMTSGRNVQMLVYLRAAQQLFPDAHVLGGAFWHLRKRELSGLTNVSEHTSVIDQAVANLHQRVVAGRAGDFVNVPSKMDGHKCSAHCEFHQLCRMNEASARKG